jgi:hypothetical protein
MRGAMAATDVVPAQKLPDQGATVIVSVSV